MRKILIMALLCLPVIGNSQVGYILPEQAPKENWQASPDPHLEQLPPPINTSVNYPPGYKEAVKETENSFKQLKKRPMDKLESLSVYGDPHTIPVPIANQNTNQVTSTYPSSETTVYNTSSNTRTTDYQKRTLGLIKDTLIIVILLLFTVVLSIATLRYIRKTK